MDEDDERILEGKARHQHQQPLACTMKRLMKMKRTKKKSIRQRRRRRHEVEDGDDDDDDDDARVLIYEPDMASHLILLDTARVLEEKTIQVFLSLHRPYLSV